MSEIDELRELLRQRDADIKQRDADIKQRDADIKQRDADIKQRDAEIKDLKTNVEILLESNRRLLHHRFGPRNEKSTEPGQLTIPIPGLSSEITYDWKKACESEKVIPERVVKPKRKRELWSQLCPNLVIEKQYIELTGDDACDADGTPLIKSGVQISEELVYTPGSLHIRQIIRQRYARSDTAEKKAIAPVPARIVPGGALANDSVLAMVVHHAMDCLPYQRIAEMISRLGAPVNRALVTKACNTYAALAAPLLDAMQKQILTTNILHIDGSFLFHQDRTRKRRCRRKPLYAVSDGNQVVMRWRDDERHETASDLIPGYTGYLVHDEWPGWLKLMDVTCQHVGCHAHARRYFAQTQDSDDDARAIVALYTEIYAVERRAADSGLVGQPLYDLRLTLRQRHTKPLFDKLFALAAEKARTRSGTIRTKLKYFAKHRHDLTVCLTDGAVPLDNNLAERVLRRNAMLRKNRLFYVNADSGQHIATLLSLMVTCRELSINPLDYLTWSLPALLAYRDHTINRPDLTQWTPLAYQQTLAQDTRAAA